MAEQSKDDVLSVIIQIVSEESGVAAKDITRETTFAQDLDVDSLGLLTIATQVEELTGFPECLDGRVKTLHPRVHAGILADRRLEAHRRQLDELDVEPFDLVVVNLYPF